MVAKGRRATAAGKAKAGVSQDPVDSLPGLGPWSAQLMARAGITSVAQLRAIGAVAAYALARGIEPRTSLNLLWALEAALSGIPWQQVARDHRTSLLLALEQHEGGGAAASAPAGGRHRAGGAGKGRGLA